MTDNELTRISKTLSYYLRHRPDELGLSLEAGGWVAVDALLAALARKGRAISRAELDEVVARNNKRRFALDETGTRLRASQGHSVEVDLELEPVTPPAVLYHGTSARALASIEREGLKKMRRHHVHLSADVAIARTVGARHGPPVVLAVDAAAMHAAGSVFYRSANGVWLVDAVPSAYLSRLDRA
ncbi:MAG TPA: RNA 2'-phosphotransferase [Chloroflexaceae bacterium]|nr:RNA 2'-phosphotransferase [Chloroflexaceae bacterium]